MRKLLEPPGGLGGATELSQPRPSSEISHVSTVVPSMTVDIHPLSDARGGRLSPLWLGRDRLTLSDGCGALAGRGQAPLLAATPPLAVLWLLQLQAGRTGSPRALPSLELNRAAARAKPQKVTPSSCHSTTQTGPRGRNGLGQALCSGNGTGSTTLSRSVSIVSLSEESRCQGTCQLSARKQNTRTDGGVSAAPV